MRSGHSETLIVLYDSMATVLQRSHLSRRNLIQVFDTMKTYLIEDHRRIFQAIVAGDAEIADRTLREHFAIGDEFRRKMATGGERKINSVD